MTNHKPFVKAWVDSYNNQKGLQGVCDTLDLDKKQVSAKANVLRRQGINLPAMPKGVQLLDVDALNDYIERNIRG